MLITRVRLNNNTKQNWESKSKIETKPMNRDRRIVEAPFETTTTHIPSKILTIARGDGRLNLFDCLSR